MNHLYLCHHGIKGQHWGIRRFQNADGTLTAAGKKRASKLEAKYEKLTGKSIKSNQKSDETPKKSTERSTEDIREETARLRAINENIKEKQTYASLTASKAKQSKGKEFADKMLQKALTSAGEALTKAGNKAIDKYLDKMMETPADKEAKRRKKEMDDLEYETTKLEKQARQSTARETMAKNEQSAIDRRQANSAYELNKKREADETTHLVNLQKQSAAQKVLRENERRMREMDEEDRKKARDSASKAISELRSVKASSLYMLNMPS